jgi:hypothetical protein
VSGKSDTSPDTPPDAGHERQLVLGLPLGGVTDPSGLQLDSPHSGESAPADRDTYEDEPPEQDDREDDREDDWNDDGEEGEDRETGGAPEDETG